MIRSFIFQLDGHHQGRDSLASLESACLALGHELPVPGRWQRVNSRRMAGRVLSNSPASNWSAEVDGCLLFVRGRLRETNGETLGPVELLGRYHQDGLNALTGLHGPGVVIVDDPKKRWVQIWRDALGDRSALYAPLKHGWLVASDERALATDRSLDEVFLSRAVAFLHPEADRTLLQGVRELPPGQVLLLGEHARTRATRPVRWPAPDRSTPSRHHAEAVEHALVLALDRCLEVNGTTALAVSGGMDASTLAALVHRHHRQRPIHLFSYRFQQFPSVDESNYVSDLADSLKCPLTWIEGDSLGPLGPRWLRDLNCGEPYVDAYRQLRLALHQSVYDAGISTLISGDFGDHLFLGAGFWLRDLLLASPSVGLGHLMRRLARSGLLAWRRDPVLRRCLPGVGLWAHKPHPPPPWCRLQEPMAIAPIRELGAGPRCSGFHSTAAARAARMGHEEAARFSIDLRFPYRDKAVLEAFAALPAFLLFDPEQDMTKPILRLIGKDALPASILDRAGKTSFQAMMNGALAGPGQSVTENLMTDPKALWRRWIDPDWLSTNHASAPHDDTALSVLWQALSLEFLDQALAGRSRAANGIDSPTCGKA